MVLTTWFYEAGTYHVRCFLPFPRLELHHEFNDTLASREQSLILMFIRGSNDDIVT